MNKKTVKNLSLAAMICALLACVIGFSVSAEDEAPTLDIISKNMSYGSNFKLAFAVDNTGVEDGQEIEVLLYQEDPAVNPEATAYKADLSTKTKYEGVYPVYFSYGIPAKDLTAYVWAQAHIVGTETYGKVYRYSAVEYFYERLYTETSDVTEAQAKLYNTVLTYCADAQAVLEYTSPAIDEVYYVYAPDTGAFGNDYSALVSADYELDLSYNGVIPVGNICKWNVKYVAQDGTVTTDTIGDGEKITSGKHVIVKPVLELISVDFDDFDRESAVYSEGILQNPADGFTMSPNATLTSPILNGVAYWATDVTESPAPKYEGDLAYKAFTKFSTKETGVITSGDSYGAMLVPIMAGEGNCYTLSYDAYIVKSGDTGGGALYQLNFVASDESVVTRMTVTGQSANGAVGFRIFSSNSKGEESYKNVSGYLNFDEWFNVKAEVYYVGSPNYYITKYFVNDVYVGEDVSYNSTTSKPINSVKLTNMIANNATVYFDDISFIASDKVYVDGAPADDFFPAVEAGILANGSGEYFSNTENEGVRFDYTDVYNNVVVSGNKDGGNVGPFITSGAQYADAYRTPSGEIYYVKQQEGPGANSHTVINHNISAAPALSDSANNQIVQIVEMDAAFKSDEANFFVISISGNGIRSDVYFHANSETGAIYFGNLADGENVSLDANTWHNFRFEVYNDNTYGNYSTIKIYVNGDYACTVKGVDYKANNGNFVTFSLRSLADEGDYVVYDNLFFGYKEVTKSAE